MERYTSGKKRSYHHRSTIGKAMYKWKLAKDHKYVNGTTFPKGSVIEQIPHDQLTYHQKKTIREEKQRGTLLICAYDPEKIMIRYWRVIHLERIPYQKHRFAPTPRKAKK